MSLYIELDSRLDSVGSSPIQWFSESPTQRQGRRTFHWPRIWAAMSELVHLHYIEQETQRRELEAGHTRGVAILLAGSARIQGTEA